MNNIIVPRWAGPRPAAMAGRASAATVPTCGGGEVAVVARLCEGGCGMTPAIIGVEHDGGGVALTMDGRDARSLRDREDGREKKGRGEAEQFLKTNNNVD